MQSEPLPVATVQSSSVVLLLPATPMASWVRLLAGLSRQAWLNDSSHHARLSDAIPKEVSMPKVLRCADVGGNCDFVARGDSDEDILQQASEHARSAHNINEITPEIADKVKAAIRDEAA
jgi:predicted small metal-binding protein